MGVSFPTGVMATAFFIGYLFTGVVSLAFAVYIVRRQWDRPAGRAFASLALASSVWALSYVGRVVAPTLGAKVVWHYLAYVGILIVPVSLLVFALLYTGRDRPVTVRVIGLLLIVPAVSWLLLVTNSDHHLFYQSVRLFTDGDVALLTSRVGPLYWVMATYSWALLLVATGLLVQFAFTSNRLYRYQSIALVVGAVIPWVANVGYLLGVRPHPVLDPTPIAIGISIWVMAVAVVQSRLLDVLPTARETVLDTIEDAVIVLDARELVIDTNRAARDLFGMSSAAVGDPASAVLSDDFWEMVQEHDRTDQWEYRRTVDDEKRVYLVHRRTVTGRRGQQWGTVLTLTDLTTQKRQQERLQEQKERLDDFASVLSHDLRNPLSVAQARVGLSQESHEDDENLATALDALGRMENLVDDTLTLSRQGRTIDETHLVDLERIVDRSRETVALNGTDVVVTNDVRIRADPERLQQLVENLLRNAVEHGTSRWSEADDAGQANSDVTVRIGRLDAEGFYVEDDGPGIPPEKRGDVLDAGVSEKADGTGFGLAIVEGIAEAHGWTFSVTESEDGGARFEFSAVDVES